MKTKVNKLNQHICSECGKQLAITVPPYLRKSLQEQKRLCECHASPKVE